MNRIRFDFTFLFRSEKDFTPELEDLIQREKDYISEIIYERMMILQNFVDKSDDIKHE